MLAQIPQSKKRIPDKLWRNLETYKPRFKASVLCDVSVIDTIEYLQDYENLRVYQSGKIYDNSN